MRPFSGVSERRMNQDQTDYVTQKLNGIMGAIKACDEVADDDGLCWVAQKLPEMIDDGCRNS